MPARGPAPKTPRNPLRHKPKPRSLANLPWVWREVHGQRVRVTVCPPSVAAGALLTRFTAYPGRTRGFTQTGWQAVDPNLAVGYTLLPVQRQTTKGEG